MERSKQLAALFLAGVFGAGFALGLTWERVGMTLGARPAGAAVATAGPRAVSGRSGRGALDSFASELALTAEQRAAVDSILDERHRIMDSLVAPVRPQLEAARESARAQIRRRLSEDQQARFDRYLVRLRETERSGRSR